MRELNKTRNGKQSDGASQEERDKKISRLMTKMLRHSPEQFGLQLDPENGSCDLSGLLAAVRSRTGYEQTTEEDIRGVVRRSDKQRFEISESPTGIENGYAPNAAAAAAGSRDESFPAAAVQPRIRARYGHSFGRLSYPRGTPPDVLYHGTNRSVLPSIREHGLLPMGREYVHLSADTHFAALAGRRRGKLVMLHLDTWAASEAGIVFYDAGSGVWLTEHVPAELLTVDEAYEGKPER